MKTQHIIITVLWVLVLVFAWYKYNANIQNKIDTLQQQTINGRIESNKKEHAKLTDLKNAFVKAWGDERLQALETENNTLRGLSTTSTWSANTGTELEKTQ